ncbi:hypothetical protein [Pseudomonas sp. FEN]|uniref:hypothetical protein n=1 Tax=Pseudomonas sp. FEN TaxID=2767468 RepID=UPI00398FBAE1
MHDAFLTLLECNRRHCTFRYIRTIVQEFGYKFDRDFTQQAEVADGATEVRHSVLTEAGVNTRTSVGMFQLPKTASVEVDRVVLLN